eukprot:2668137-Amphidinium_carterae.1
MGLVNSFETGSSSQSLTRRKRCGCLAYAPSTCVYAMQHDGFARLGLQDRMHHYHVDPHL